MNYNFEIEMVHISQIRVGDVIKFRGHHRTISGNNLKHDSFMGISIFGDSYRLGNELVTKINIRNENN